MKQLDKMLEKNTYLAGDEISIADLSAACELHQIRFLEEDYSKYENVSRWMNVMERIPEMGEVNEFVNRAIEKTRMKATL